VSGDRYEIAAVVVLFVFLALVAVIAGAFGDD